LQLEANQELNKKKPGAKDPQSKASWYTATAQEKMFLNSPEQRSLMVPHWAKVRWLLLWILLSWVDRNIYSLVQWCYRAACFARKSNHESTVGGIIPCVKSQST
jgi:hypothetical protein